MRKQEILDRLNKAIKEEKGRTVGIDDTLKDAELDSLGTTVVLITMDSEYQFIDPEKEDEFFESVPTLTIKELIRQCILANTNTSTAANVVDDNL